MASKHPGRKPANLVADAKRPEGRQVIWQAIRQLKQFTILDIEGVTRINIQTIRTYVSSLQLAGYLSKNEPNDTAVNSGQFKRMIWILIKDPGVDAPRLDRNGAEVTRGRGRENMWRGIKVLKQFTASELAGVASAGNVTVSVKDTRRYLSYLCKAGYLKQEGKTNGEKRYTLIISRYSGPLPPIILRVSQLFDPNIGQVVWAPNVTEVAND